jgi:glutamate synthase domain-containing protein 3
VAARLVEHWEASLARFVKVLPYDYERALAEQAAREAAPAAAGA